LSNLEGRNIDIDNVAAFRITLVMLENNATDWILINLKFRGKCIDCNKEIISGRALWSKTRKSIKHLDCSVGDVNRTLNYEETATHKPGSPKSIQYRKTIAQRCFICRMEEPDEDEYDIKEYPYLRAIKSPSYICRSCLGKENAFDAYRSAFLQKIKDI
jgi:hypothetical protein